jgi:hypothetical protein
LIRSFGCFDRIPIAGIDDDDAFAFAHRSDDDTGQSEHGGLVGGAVSDHQGTLAVSESLERPLEPLGQYLGIRPNQIRVGRSQRFEVSHAAVWVARCAPDDAITR